MPPTPKYPPLSSKGRILAVKLLDEPYEMDPMGPAGNAGIVKWYGYSPVLKVEGYIPKTQSTLFFGQNIYQLNQTGVLDQMTRFAKFVDIFVKNSGTWGELEQIPRAPWLTPIYLQPQQPQTPPVAEAKLTCLGGGYDNFRGYWVEFLGNFFLSFPLFRPASGSNYQGPSGTGTGVLNGALPGAFDGPWEK